MLEEKEMEIKDEYDIVGARSVGKVMAQELGLGVVDQSRISTAISELARNVVLYAGKGKIHFRVVRRGSKEGLEVTVSDEGPGIPDVELAMMDGYTTSGGLGVGLPGAKRLTDEFEIRSEVGKGTVVTFRKWKR